MAGGRADRADRADGADWADRDDRDLLTAHADGDPDAFGELVRRHRDRLWAVAVRTLGDREEAADALQEALVSAYRHAGSYRGEAAVTTWLHRIVVNACLDRVRRARARRTDPLPPTDVPDPRDDHAATEARLDVRAALARLPEHQRVALVLVDLHELTVAEAAQVLGVAEGTVKSRCARGRAALALALRPGNPAPDADVPPPTTRSTPTTPATPTQPAPRTPGDPT